MHSVSINVVFRCTNEGIQVCCLGRIHHTCLVKKNNCSFSSMMSAAWLHRGGVFGNSISMGPGLSLTVDGGCSSSLSSS